MCLTPVEVGRGGGGAVVWLHRSTSTLWQIGQTWISLGMYWLRLSWMNAVSALISVAQMAATDGEMSYLLSGTFHHLPLPQLHAFPCLSPLSQHVAVFNPPHGSRRCHVISRPPFFFSCITRLPTLCWICLCEEGGMQNSCKAKKCKLNWRLYIAARLVAVRVSTRLVWLTAPPGVFFGLPFSSFVMHHCFFSEDAKTKRGQAMAERSFILLIVDQQAQDFLSAHFCLFSFQGLYCSSIQWSSRWRKYPTLLSIV